MMKEEVEFDEIGLDVYFYFCFMIQCVRYVGNEIVFLVFEFMIEVGVMFNVVFYIIVI